MKQPFTLFLIAMMLVSSTLLADDNVLPETPPLTAEQISQIRSDIIQMADETLQQLYEKHPESKLEIEAAYGYGVFEGQAVNMLIFVAGKGLGVVYDNETKSPIFMNAIRAGTGPGIGYKSLRGVLIFENETVYDQFTTIGLQVSASGDAVAKFSNSGVEKTSAISLVPGVKLYQLIDSGLVLQANWGATEFLKDSQLNNQ